MKISEAAMQAMTDRLGLVEDEADYLCGELGKEVRHRAAMRTPVLLGRARANWRLGIGDPDPYTDPDERDPTGQNGDAEAHEVARNARVGLTLWISNRLPYIRPLNNGWSKKAPAGFIEQTIGEVPFLVRMLAKGMAGRLHGRGLSQGKRLGTSGRG